MAINYTWNVKNCDVYPTKSGKSNVIHKVHWRLLGTDDTNTTDKGTNWSATRYGAADLDTSDLSNFKTWSSLTEANVQAMVENHLTADVVTRLKTEIATEISEAVSPTTSRKVLGG